MTAYLDDALPAGDRARLDAHVEDCPNCREYLAQLRTTVAALGRAEPADLDPAVLDELVGLYRRWRTG
jgi:anti-sigma factor RsiW